MQPLRSLLRQFAVQIRSCSSAALALASCRARAQPKRCCWSRPIAARCWKRENATVSLASGLAHQADDGLCHVEGGQGRQASRSTRCSRSRRWQPSQSPSKMGFRPGTQVTVDNALKMMMVKSANDMAVVLAEGVGGSIDGFSAMMNDTAQQLGMTQTQLRQSERPARRRPDHLGARSRDPGPRDHPRPAGIRIFRAHPLDPLRPAGHAELQQADRPLSRRRRLQDRLHLRLRLQSGGLRHAQRQPADRGRARRLLRQDARRARGADARSRLQRQRADAG